MNAFSFKKIMIFVAVFALIVSLSALVGCDDTKTDNGGNNEKEVITDMGKGANSFLLEVVNAENTAKFNVKTDKTTVGEALFELNFISGNETDDGFFITTVNGITANYDAEGTYWVFYAGGAYAQTAAFDTKIADGETYSFKLER